jgi:arogenate/prephenate dehydratase
MTLFAPNPAHLVKASKPCSVAVLQVSITRTRDTQRASIFARQAVWEHRGVGRRASQAAQVAASRDATLTAERDAPTVDKPFDEDRARSAEAEQPGVTQSDTEAVMSDMSDRQEAPTSAHSDQGSSALGTTSTVAYQGVPGAYSEVASLAALPGWDHVPCNTFEAVFQALTEQSAERAVLPVENSLGGSIHEIFDLMAKFKLHIVAETLVDVNHCLLALPGVQKADLRKILSHPQALAQVDRYLRSFGAHSTQKAVFDTAGAAEMIAKNGWTDVGAIASARAAELYGLNIVERNVQDDDDNVTRFVVLAREPLVISAPRPGEWRTSIVFSLAEGPGMLFQAIAAFTLHNINMTKIESRPLLSAPIAFEAASRRRSYNYLFFIDFNGSTAEAGVKEALEKLESYATFLRVLGSYPKGS